MRIREVSNYEYTDRDSLNICFTTIQGLSSSLWNTKENGLWMEDFSERKMVLISDEAHHLNAETKKPTKAEKEEYHSWEGSVKSIFTANRENVLLEFTATAGLSDPAIREKNRDSLLFHYELTDFYKDRYSKDILTLRSSLDVMDRALAAVVLSQYRLKLFEKHRIRMKPVILFKAYKIADSKAFMQAFVKEIGHLSAARLQHIRDAYDTAESEVIKQAFRYFEENGITLEALTAELRDDFSEIHCISVNDDKEAETRQILLNTLEDEDNPYRAIFEVKKLDEGWDVLNLFNIVRLYETRQSGGKKISNTTISEAQLIGRGARYCPFRLDDEQPRYQRKYDDDIDDEMRVCETLYYHCQNDHRYVAELHRALKEIGWDDKGKECTYRLKDSFKQDNLYRQGMIFLNGRRAKKRDKVTSLDGGIRDRMYTHVVSKTSSGVDALLGDAVEVREQGGKVSESADYTVGEIASRNYAIVHTAMQKVPFFRSCTLKRYFPQLATLRDFILSDKYLGGVQIQVQGTAEPSNEDLMQAVYHAALQMAESLRQTETEFQLDLTKSDWFAYGDNFGTTEESCS